MNGLNKSLPPDFERQTADFVWFLLKRKGKNEKRRLKIEKNSDG
jgi:hypothetical protein